MVSIADQKAESGINLDSCAASSSVAARDVDHIPDRALPTWAIDSLVFGMSKYASATKIWGRIVSVAMVAQQRGWSQTEFVTEVTKTERRTNGICQKRLMRHELWTQLVACSRHEAHAFRQLDRAWFTAADNRANLGFRTNEDLFADALERAYGWDDRLTEGKDGLPDSEMLVMGYVIAFIEKREMTRVTCSVREVADFTGLPKSTVHRALTSLTAKAFLVRFSRGFWSENTSNRRAAIYGLSDPLSLRYGGRGAPSDTADVWRQFVAARDAPEATRIRQRGICVWGDSLGQNSLVPLPIGT